MKKPERERLDPLLARATRALRDEPPASPADVAQVMARVRARPLPARQARPQRSALLKSIVVPLYRYWWIAAGLAAAAIVLFVAGALRRDAASIARPPNDVLAPGELAASPGAPRDSRGAGGSAVNRDLRDVRFVLDAPGASRVAVAGDFNHWQPVQLRRQGDSSQWIITLPIAEGTYSYSFMVEGRRWVADPVAPVAPDDGFGAPSSVLIVESHDRKGST